MEIVRCTINDLDKLVDIKSIDRKHMIEEGNITQWNGKDDDFIKEVTKFIKQNSFYIVKDDDEVVGMFALVLDVDHTYDIIKDGKWLNDDKYVVIHKMGVKYFRKHIGSFILNYVKKMAISHNVHNIRIDTHKDNISMNNFLLYHGFKRCGIISINYDFNDKNSLREAYQLII